MFFIVCKQVTFFTDTIIIVSLVLSHEDDARHQTHKQQQLPHDNGWG
jgi:hypothetical protein